MFDRSGYFHVQHAHNCCDSFLKYFSHWKTHGQFAGLSSFRSGSGLDGRYRIHLSGWQNPESVGTRRHQDVGRAINGSWGRRAGTPRRSVRDQLLWINRSTGTVKMKSRADESIIKTICYSKGHSRDWACYTPSVANEMNQRKADWSDHMEISPISPFDTLLCLFE